jgi:hypothetical protein
MIALGTLILAFTALVLLGGWLHSPRRQRRAEGITLPEALASDEASGVLSYAGRGVDR